MHDACEAEPKGYCGKGCDDGPCGYTNEATYCLTLWMNQDEVSAACKKKKNFHSGRHDGL